MFFIGFLAFFIPPFYKMMLGKVVTFEDLQSVVGVAKPEMSSLISCHMTGCGNVQWDEIHS